MPKFFTLKIELCNGEKIIFNNLTEEQIKEVKEKIWVQGIVRAVPNDRFAKELVNPLIIKSAIIIEQENFIG